MDILGLDEQNLLELDDHNGNGYYDIKDFIEAPEKEILKFNDNMKFDVCLMNPPYGTTGGDDLHYRFTEKCIQLCDEVVCVMPFALVDSNTRINLKYKPILSSYLLTVEEIESTVFNDTTQFNVGIYKFKSNKNKKENIEVKYLSGNIINCETLSTDFFNKYEHNFLDIISSNGMINIVHGVGDFSHFNSECKKKKIKPTIELRKKYQLKNCNKLLSGKYYLNVNIANGSKTATFINLNTNGNIFTSKDNLISYILNRSVTSGYNILVFDNMNSAKNCKISLQNPLLRFTLSKLQTGQNIPANCFRYVPDIDWSDPRVVTDEGLLEVCGCPKDKCKEYAEYCKNYMEEFDKK